MKTKLFALWVLAAAVSLGGLVGCIKDTAIDDPNANGGNSSGMGHSYLSFKISSVGSAAPGTRADDNGWSNGSTQSPADGNFQDGDNKEHYVENALVVLFDNQGNYLRHDTLEETTPNSNELVNNVLTFDFTSFPLGSGNPDAPIAWAVVVLNGDTNQLTEIAQGGLWEFAHEARSHGKTTTEKAIYTTLNNGEPRFVMSNSVYATNSITGMPQAEMVRYAEPLYSDNFKETEEAAEAAPVTIHVEPLAAKVEVDFFDKSNAKIEQFGDTAKAIIYKSEDYKNTEGAMPFLSYYDPFADTENDEQIYTQIPYAVRIFGWGLNATAKTEYRVKALTLNQYGNVAPLTTLAPSWEFTMNNTPWYWNDASRSRSYWAVSPTYLEGTYPTKNRGSYTAATSDFKTPNSDYSLNYVSFDEVKLQNKNENTANTKLTERTKYKYCTENTYAKTSDAGAGVQYRTAATSVIFPAQLLIGDEINLYNTDATPNYNGVADKYWIGGNIMALDAYIYECIRQFSESIRSYVRNSTEVSGKELTEFSISYKNTKFYEAIGGTSADDAGSVSVWGNTKHTAADLTNSAWFTIEKHPELDGGVMPKTKAGVVMSDFSISYKVSGEAAAKTIDLTNNMFAANATTSKDAFETTMESLKNLEAKLYKNGRMYYSQPIRHQTQLSAPTDNSDLPTGYYGVVRNHWYHMQVKSAMRPGEPVSDPNEPIVPNYDPKLKYLGVQVDILNWHHISQDVDL